MASLVKASDDVSISYSEKLGILRLLFELGI